MSPKRTQRYFLGTLRKTKKGWRVIRMDRRRVGASSLSDNELKRLEGHFLLWHLDADARPHVAHLQPRELQPLQPNREFPAGLQAARESVVTGDAQVDRQLELIGRGRVREALYVVKSAKKRRKSPDDRNRSTSVRAVSGGASESNRRRH